jgi:hypothetical protein
MGRRPIGKTAMTDAERHKRYMARLRARAAAGENNVTRDKPAAFGRGKQLELEILVDDEGDGFISADMGSFDLYVNQNDDNTFRWFVLKSDEDDDKDPVYTAEGEASSLVAAMKAAEAAAFPHWLGAEAIKSRAE